MFSEGTNYIPIVLCDTIRFAGSDEKCKALATKIASLENHVDGKPFAGGGGVLCHA
jgi:hypothetical protein